MLIYYLLKVMLISCMTGLEWPIGNIVKNFAILQDFWPLVCTLPLQTPTHSKEVGGFVNVCEKGQK